PDGNRFDAKINANNIYLTNASFPQADASPAGYREILQTVFYDDFEGVNNWTINGKFQIAAPTGRGAADGLGNPDPAKAYSATKVLGTGLTGTKEKDFDYDTSLVDKEWKAISPILNCKYYNNLYLRFYRWLNIEVWDRATLEISNDGGSSWIVIWENTNYISDKNWTMQEINISNYADKKEQVQIRFTLGPTNNSFNYSGWNIDDVQIYGNFLDADVAVSQWITPQSGCGLSNSEKITIKVDNYAGLPTNDTIPMRFSIDGGNTYIKDTIFESIPVGGSKVFTTKATFDFSQGGYYNTIAETLLEKDEAPANNLFTGPVIFAIPTYRVPYSTTFENDNGFFVVKGNNSSWEWGRANGDYLKNGSSGFKSWTTNLTGLYNYSDSSWIESPCYDLTGNNFPVIEFKQNRQINAFNAAFTVQYSTDNGENWTTVPKNMSKWNWFSTNNNALLLSYFGDKNGWTDTSYTWVTSKHLLPEEVKHKPNVRFRFAFASGPISTDPINTRGEGVSIDDFRLYNAPIDIGVIHIDKVATACELTANEPIKITIKNFGLDTLKAGRVINLGVKINNNQPVHENYTLPATVSPNQTFDYTFTATFNMADSGTYNIAAYTRNPEDINFFDVSNDTAYHITWVYGMPHYTLGPDFGAEFPENVILDAKPGYTTYQWDGGPNTRFYAIPGAGTYKVTVTNQFNCTAEDEITVIESKKDIKMLSATGLASACSITEPQSVEIRFSNNHNHTYIAGTNLVFAYRINNNTPVVETFTLPSDFEVNDELTYTFTQQIDLTTVGTYKIKFYSILADDINFSNDTIYQTIGHWGQPKVNLGPDTIRTKTAKNITLNAGAGFQTYKWSTGDNTQTLA
ncbi:MAG: hypothetical protein SNJ71_08755, partial [Bacteroidales bacterium]